MKWLARFFFLGAAGLSGIAPAGLWMGEGLIHRSADSSGYSWIGWIFLFSGALTSAAVFRVGARVFLGWGPSREDEPGGSPKSEESQETQSGHESTPFSMIASAAVLVVLGFSYGFIPGLQEGALKFAWRFEDSAQYAAHVLAGVPQSTPAVLAPSPASLYSGLWSLALAVTAAVLHLSNKRFRNSATIFAKPIVALQGLHSGHLGDYVTFLTFGIAAFGLFCIAGLAQ